MNEVVTVCVSTLLLASMSVDAGEQPDYARLSCNELYVLASELEPGTQRFRSPLFNTKTDVIATAVGSVTNIGYYYFGFSTGREYFEDYRRNERRHELDRIRANMAQQYCFQKS